LPRSPLSAATVIPETSGEQRQAAFRGPAAIEDHALIGDTRTAALVTSRGEIDWLCLPRFESPPVFGSLIGGERGGRFAISPLELRSTTRRYLPGSAVLETTWDTATGRARLTDGLVADLSGGLLPQLLLVRRVEGVHGEVDAQVLFDARRDLRERPRRTRRTTAALTAEWGPLKLLLRTTPDLELASGIPREIRLRAGEMVTFALSAADRAPGVLVGPERAWELLGSTDRWWRGWTERIEYEGPNHDEVVRSLITLRLLTYVPSGAPVAAPTTSLPEEPGGERNWDYRLSWPRDAGSGMTAFLGFGHREEARAFLVWLTIASRLTRPRVKVLYDLEGRPGVKERERRDVPGYRGSLPVRIGNAAGDQHQLDVYGWIVGAAWELHRAGERLPPDVWRAVAGWADFVCTCWREPTTGIWENRGEPRHYVHSKLMGWMALDRAIRMTDSYRVRRSRRDRWRAERTALGEDIRSRGIDPDRDAYVGRYGSSELDAALLMLPEIGIEDPKDPRVVATVDAIGTDLDAGGGLLYRYPRTEGSGGPGEGAFLACSFWMVRALCMIGRIDEAVELFGSLCARANDVGLFGEQLDPGSGKHLGNFPQALTHSALAGAALSIRATRASTRSRG
jgi:GH15 family glucan-1,4-alpha-glucosidase